MKSLAVMLTLIPFVALADADQRFAKLRDQAEAMGAVSAFVEKYVGDCASKMLGGGECEKNAEVFRLLGFSYESSKNYAKALAAYERGLQLAPADAYFKESAERVRPFAK